MAFKETPEKYNRNRQLMQESRIERAILADGTKGVVAWVGKFPILMTRAEAISFATRIADKLETP